MRYIPFMYTWPPAYTLKTNRLAKAVRFRISRTKGLEITIPARFSQKKLLSALEQQRSWIEQHKADIEYYLTQTQQPELPHVIYLASIEKTWQIHYLEEVGPLRLIMQSPTDLLIRGELVYVNACQRLLKRWLKQQAQLILAPLLQTLSLELGLPYARLTIKLQTSRWGSCSHAKNINLNAKLLFLPAHLVRSILVHELCHTIHLNHSKKFWALVEQFDPNWRAYNKSLRKAQTSIPAWVG